jgi:hypothetical protein
MIPTLEELRKSLLTTPEVSIDQPPSSNYQFQTTSAHVHKSAPPSRPDRRQPPAAPPIHHPFAQLLEDDPFAELRAELERAAADIQDAGADVEAAKPPVDVAEAVALVFGSSAAYEEHLARLADASQSIRRVNRIAEQVFEPLKIFRDKVTLGEHLFALSKSLESAKALHAHLVSLARAFDAAEELESELNKLARRV